MRVDEVTGCFWWCTNCAACIPCDLVCVSAALRASPTVGSDSAVFACRAGTVWRTFRDRSRGAEASCGVYAFSAAVSMLRAVCSCNLVLPKRLLRFVRAIVSFLLCCMQVRFGCVAANSARGLCFNCCVLLGQVHCCVALRLGAWILACRANGVRQRSAAAKDRACIPRHQIWAAACDELGSCVSGARVYCGSQQNASHSRAPALTPAYKAAQE